MSCERPEVLGALNPLHGVAFLRDHGIAGLFALGAVFLAVTGAEALYADLGHFGRGPIRTAWLAVVFPALAVNYLGQGALLLANPAADREPLLPALSGVGADPHGGSRHGGHRHRQPGGHHRRVLDHAAGGAARAAAALRREAARPKWSGARSTSPR